MSVYRVGDRSFPDTAEGRTAAYGYAHESGLAVTRAASAEAAGVEPQGDTTPRQPRPSLTADGNLESKLFAVLGRRVFELVREVVRGGAEEQSIEAEQQKRMNPVPPPAPVAKPKVPVKS